MQKNCVIIENVRSAYNVGNIIRTADALGWDVCISGYSPHPARDEKVVKSSLGAESTVACKDFRNPYEALQYYKKQGYLLIAAELTSNAISLQKFSGIKGGKDPFALVMGNEITGVLQETLDFVDHIVCIPMQGKKASLNVGQAAAIMMRECGMNQK